MNISDYQILNVIKTYIKNMRNKVDSADAEGSDREASDESATHDEQMKKMVFDRIGEIVTEKIKKHET